MFHCNLICAYCNAAQCDEKENLQALVFQLLVDFFSCIIADDHRMLVEPACGAALAPFYLGTIKKLQDEGKLGEVHTAVVIVCGGHCVTREVLEAWQKQTGATP